MRLKPAAAYWILSLWALASCASADSRNLTGLLMYPHLSDAVMDSRFRTDAMGRWCSHFSASTNDSLELVQNWFRKTWRGAGETDLSHDAAYGDYVGLDGIKLVIDVDSVAVYKASKTSPTLIDAHRCSPIR